MTAREKTLAAQPEPRRKALAGLAGFLAGAKGVHAQQDEFRDHSRIPGLSEMRDVFDFEAAAYERLDRATYNYTARGGGSEFTTRRNREAFDLGLDRAAGYWRSRPLPKRTRACSARRWRSRSCWHRPRPTKCCIRTRKRPPTPAAKPRPRLP